MNINTRHIDASPTKDFFISILIRDVLLPIAIGDLIDNCVDGAKRIRPDKDYSGLRIKVNYDAEKFEIEDNCGGIPVEIAEKYAFRFGRPKDMPASPGSIGEFGVGMKRSLFKMGGYFSITSMTQTESFSVEVDVEEWKTLYEEVGVEEHEAQGEKERVKKEKWEFGFKELHTEQVNSPEVCGTFIRITKLHENIIEEFKLANFTSRLVELVRSQQAENIERGIEIVINGHSPGKSHMQLLQSDQIQPLYTRKTLDGKTGEIAVRIYAGIDEPKLEDSGWYVICNSRLVLKANRERLTGWDEKTGEDTDTPKAHYQFARFRGYVYFDSDSPSLVPWNTTKSSVDAESPIYQATRLDMIPAMRQVIEFLNKLKGELDKDETRLEKLINEAKPVRLSEITPSPKFVFPKAETVSKPKTGKITYERPIEDVMRAKEILGVTTNKEVGEKTFEYFMSLEAEE